MRLGRRAGEPSGRNREARPGSREAAPQPSRGGPPAGEAKLVQVTREAVARIGPELRRLEKLRSEVLAQLGKGASGGEAGKSGEESLLAPLARILEHGILGIEEGWAELHECFSERGLARLRRKRRTERAARASGNKEPGTRRTALPGKPGG